MLSPKLKKAPQQTNPACNLEDSFRTSKPTLLGTAPVGLEQRFTTVATGQLPEFTKLPPARGRCPLTGASRSWILDMEKLGKIKIVRVRQPGKMRGACFVYVPSLLALLRSELNGGSQ